MNMGGRQADEVRHEGLNQTKNMMSGVESGMDESGGDTMMGRGDRMGDMPMGHDGSNNKGRQVRGDNHGGNPLSKMMGGIGGGKGSNRHDENPSMGDKLKGTYEQTKGKVMNDPQTTRRGEMRKQPGGADSADIMGGSGI